MEMTQRKKTTKRGRPPGSKNRTEERPRQHVEPVRCPNCESTEYSRAWPVMNVKRNGTTPEGKPFDQFITSVKQCKNCGTEFVVDTWRYQGKTISGDPVDPYKG